MNTIYILHDGDIFVDFVFESGNGDTDLSGNNGNEPCFSYVDVCLTGV